MDVVVDATWLKAEGVGQRYKTSLSERDLMVHAIVDETSPYAEGVIFHSPGSAQPRSGGAPPWVTPHQHLRYAEGVRQNGVPCRTPSAYGDGGTEPQGAPRATAKPWHEVRPGLWNITASR